MHAFTLQQRSKLQANPNVRVITEKTVSFTSAFKIKAVRLYQEGWVPNDIFLDAKIPLEFFNEDYARLCIKKWIRKFESEGEDSLKVDGRGSSSSGRPKSENLDELTYDELKALVAIQKEALNELRKQNALARKKKR